MSINNIQKTFKALLMQCAKKVVSGSPGLVDFSIGLVNSVDNSPDRQVKFLGKFKLQKCNQFCWSAILWRLVEMTFGLVHHSKNLPKWQAVKLTFFAPCDDQKFK